MTPCLDESGRLVRAVMLHIDSLNFRLHRFESIKATFCQALSMGLDLDADFIEEGIREVQVASRYLQATMWGRQQWPLT